MKPRFKSLIAAFAPLSRSSIIICASLCAATSVHAASDAWDGSTDATWATGTNWVLDTTAPGSGETATFNGAGGADDTINLGAGVTVGSIIFDLTPDAYTIGSGAVGSQTLTLNAASGNSVTLNATVLTTQTINANILHNTGDNTLRLVNSTSVSTGPSLIVNGTIQGGTGATARTINTGGNVTLNGLVTAGSATSIAISNTGVGTLTLAGSGASALTTLRATGINGNVTVNNATANITVANSSSYGPGSSGSSDFILTTGTVAFNGGLTQANNSADGGGFIVNGGTFSASSIFTHRTFNFSTTGGANTGTAQSMGTSGFQVNGGIATVTGNVTLAGSNSAANGQVSGTGSLTIGGELILGSSATTRTTLFQVTGGTFANTDVTTGGIVLGKGSASVASSGELLITGGTTTTEKITFGLNGGLAGSFGNLTINGASGSLYIGSGGLVKAATNAFTDSINLANGTLGAKADWSTSMNVNFNGSGMILKAADALDVAKNITLTGVLTGTGSFTKSGGGTLTITNSANTVSGTATISAGILRITDANALQNAVVAASGMDMEDGFKIATGITSPVIGGLGGSANFELINESSVPLALQLGNTSATYNGVLSGTGSISKIGAGTQALTATGQLYTGTTSVSVAPCRPTPRGNTLSNLFGAGSINLSNGGRIRFNSTGGATFNHDLVVGTGGGILSFRGNSTFSPASITASDTLTLSVDDIVTISVTDLLDFTGRVNAVTAGATGYFRLNSFDNTSMVNMALDLGAGMILSRNAGTNGAITTDIGTLSGAATSIVGISSAGGGTFTFSVGSRNENSTYAGTIVDGGTKTALTKVGNTGILTLSGINTYTGATIVSSGTLALSGAGSIDNSSSVTIAAGAELDTTAKTGTYTLAGAQPFVFGLDGGGSGSSGKIDAASLDISSAAISFDIAGTLDDSQYVLATYSGTLTGTFAASAPAGYTYDYGTGTNSQIKLVSVGASGYDAWDDQIPNAADRDRTDDPDGDGFTNIQEYLFGTSPIAGNGSLSTTEKSGGTLIIRWKERETASEADYQLKESATLLGGSWTNSAAPVSNDGAASGGYQPRRADVTIGSGKLFFRVEGVETN